MNHLKHTLQHDKKIIHLNSDHVTMQYCQAQHWYRLYVTSTDCLTGEMRAPHRERTADMLRTALWGRRSCSWNKVPSCLVCSWLTTVCSGWGASAGTSRSGSCTAAMALQDTGKTPTEPEAVIHGIRITLTSRKVSGGGVCWPDQRRKGKDSQSERTSSEAHQDSETHCKKNYLWGGF